MSALAIAQKTLTAAGFAVYPILIPQDGTLPSVVIKLTGEDQHYNIDQSARQFRSTVRFECLASTPAGMDDLAESLKSALENEVCLSIEIAGIDCLVTFIKRGVDFSDYSDNRTVFRRILDYDLLWYEI